MRVSLVQLRTPATHAEALAHAAPFIRQAAKEGARLVLTPECTNVVQRDRTRLLPSLRPLDEDSVVTGLRELAAELRVQVLIGSALVRREDGAAANRSVLVGADGAILASYDKIHMFDVDLPTGERIRESAAYTPGDAACVADSAVGRLGLTVCYDLRFPHLFRALAQAGAQAIAVPSCFTRPTGEAHWEVLLRARAIETGAFILAPAQGGVHEDGRGTWGRTLAVAPWGELLGVLDHDAPGVLTVDLDLSKVEAARRAVPSLTNTRAFTLPEPAAPEMAA